MNSRRRQYPIVLVEKVVTFARQPEVTTRQLKEYAAELFGAPVPQSTIANWLSRNGVRLLDSNRTAIVEQASVESRLFMRSPAAIRERQDVNGQERKILTTVYNILSRGETIGTEKVLSIVHQQYPNLTSRQLENIFQKYMLTYKIIDYERNQIRYEQLVRDIVIHFPELQTPMNLLDINPNINHNTTSNTSTSNTTTTTTSHRNHKIPTSKTNHNKGMTSHPSIIHTSPEIQAHSIQGVIHRDNQHNHPQSSDPRAFQPTPSSHYHLQQIPIQLPTNPISLQNQSTIVHTSPATSPINQQSPHHQSPLPSPSNSHFAYSSPQPLMSQVQYPAPPYALHNQAYPPINPTPLQQQRQQQTQYQYPLYYSPYVDPNQHTSDLNLIRTTGQSIWVPPQA